MCIVLAGADSSRNRFTFPFETRSKRRLPLLHYFGMCVRDVVYVPCSFWFSNLHAVCVVLLGLGTLMLDRSEKGLRSGNSMLSRFVQRCFSICSFIGFCERFLHLVWRLCCNIGTFSLKYAVLPIHAC